MMFDMFMYSLGLDMPPEVKEEFNELYSTVQNFQILPQEI